MRPAESVLHDGRRGSRGFTLVELLVVIAIIVLLIAILLPVLAKARSAAEKARELAAANQLLRAYHAYIADHDDLLLPGFLDRFDFLVEPPFRVEDEQSRVLHDIIAQRYAWRIAPYMNYDFEAMILDRSTFGRAVQLEDDPQSLDGYQHAMSNVTTLAMNFDLTRPRFRKAHSNPADPALLHYKKFYATHAGQILRPDMLIVFASARQRNRLAPGEPIEMFQGRYTVEAPRGANTTADRPYGNQVQLAWDPSMPPQTYGYLDLRFGAKAVIGFFDGHADTMGLVPGERSKLRDMRHWNNFATEPDWRPPTYSGGGS